jgi:hypothetical protein
MQQFRDMIFGQAQSAGNVPGLDGMTRQANDTISGLLGGDPAVLKRFMDPYQDQVIGGLGQQYDRLRSQAQMQGADQAMQAGAFGGSRHGIAQGTRLGEIDRAQGQQVGGLLSQGFGDAYARASGLASQAAGMGEYNRGVAVDQSPWGQIQRLMGVMQGSPYGQTRTSQTESSGLLGMIPGLASIAGGILLPGAGGAIGSLLGGAAAGGAAGGSGPLSSGYKFGSNTMNGPGGPLGSIFG